MALLLELKIAQTSRVPQASSWGDYVEGSPSPLTFHRADYIVRHQGCCVVSDGPRFKSPSFLRQTVRQQEKILCMEISDDGKYVITGCDDGGVKIFQTLSMEIVQEFSAHRGGIRACIFVGSYNVSEGRVATGGRDSQIKLWFAGKKPEPLLVLMAHQAAVTSLRVSPDLTTLLSTSMDGTVCLWDLGNTDSRPAPPWETRLQLQLQANPDGVLGCLFKPSGINLISWGSGCDNEIREWDLSTTKGDSTSTINFMDSFLCQDCGCGSTNHISLEGELRSTFSSLSLSKKPLTLQTVATLFHNVGLAIEDADAAGAVAQIKLLGYHRDKDDSSMVPCNIEDIIQWFHCSNLPDNLQYSRDFAGVTRGKCRLHNDVNTPKGQKSCSAFRPKQITMNESKRDERIRQLLVISRNLSSQTTQDICIEEARSSREAAIRKLPFLVYGDSNEHMAKTFKSASRSVTKATGSGHTAAVTHCSLSYNGGHLLASASDDKSILLWDTQTRRVVRKLLAGGGQGCEMTYCHFNKDNEYLVGCSRNGRVHLWSLQDGQHLQSIDGHEDAVVTCQFLPLADKLSVVSSSYDGKVKIWQVEAGVPGKSSQPPKAVIVRSRNSIRVTWLVPLQGNLPIKHYVVSWQKYYRYDRANSIKEEIETKDDKNGLLLKNLAWGRTFEFQVAAVNEMGQGDFSELSLPVTTPSSVPSTVEKAPVMYVLNETTMRVVWKSPDPNGSNIRKFMVLVEGGPVKPGSDGSESLEISWADALDEGMIEERATSSSREAIEKRVSADPILRAAVAVQQRRTSRRKTTMKSPLRSNSSASHANLRCTLACTVTGLEPQGTYRAKVAAFNDIGKGPFSPPSISVDLVPSAITDVSIGATQDLQLAIHIAERELHPGRVLQPLNLVTRPPSPQPGSKSTRGGASTQRTGRISILDDIPDEPHLTASKGIAGDVDNCDELSSSMYS